MLTRSLIGGWVLALAAVAGCYTGASIDPGSAPKQSSDGTDPVSGGDPVTGDLPCDVAQVLADNCQSCHGSPLAGGAPNRIMTHDDLAAASTVSGKTVAQLSVARMRDTKRPMPPSGTLPDATIAVLDKWIAGGMATGTCGGSGSTTNTNTASVCTSGTTWNGRRGSAMQPGSACLDCHGGGEESFAVGGTVYPTAHEPDDCNGIAGSSIVIMDANGKTVLTMTANSAGNFYGGATLPSPYTAKVVSADGTKTRAMATPQKSGDCNSCHTESGANSAPGRVMVP